MNAKHAATKITGTVAKPSSPSVRLTAFEEPTITKAAKGIKNQPKLIIRFLKKGKYKLFKSAFSEKWLKNKIPIAAIKIWEKIFILNEMPDEFLNLIFL